jgi:hypothetical protein
MAQTDNGTTGIGDDDIDEDGQPDPVQSQAETGGSGGAGLTRNDGDGEGEREGDSDGVRGIPARPPHPPTESGALGAQDTRADQAGADKATGLGSAESGANQVPGDLGPGA